MKAIKLSKPQKTHSIVAANGVAKYIKEEILNEDFEMFKEHTFVLCLNAHHDVIGHYNIGVGGLDSCEIDKRIVVAAALFNYATAIIIVHNHPSNYVQPSPRDIRTTKCIQDACKLFDIALTDHVIFGDDEIYSFHDQEVFRFDFKS